MLPRHIAGVSKRAGGQHINIYLLPEIVAAGYSNIANLSPAGFDFSVTFARVDQMVDDEEVPGVVVSRVTLSPRFMRELIDAMEDNFAKWQTREGIRNLPDTGQSSPPPPPES